MRDTVVVGTGRAGTSLVAGLLADAGGEAGGELLEADDANPRGYFEDRRVNALNEELLAPLVPGRPSDLRRWLPPWRLRPRHGERWLGAMPLNLTVVPTVAQLGTMRRLLERRPVVLKDPRLTFTLDAWRPALPPDTAFVCVFREPGRTVASMLRMIRGDGPAWRAPYWVGRRRLLAIWTLQYRWVLERHRLVGDWCFLHYDQLVHGRALQTLSAHVDAPLTGAHVDPWLDRSRDDGPPPPAGTAAVYRKLCALARHRASTA